MKREDNDDNDDIKIYDLESKLGHVTYFDMTHPQKATNTLYNILKSTLMVHYILLSVTAASKPQESKVTLLLTLG